ncbi:hypothetical protein [Streptomyces sp. NPDC051677]|uniref:hypothetical protein n=1 Tax=Streptomyces sp. NPDC051677 TaxID=3365669 RepID=UPI0037D6ADDE
MDFLRQMSVQSFHQAFWEGLKVHLTEKCEPEQVRLVADARHPGPLVAGRPSPSPLSCGKASLPEGPVPGDHPQARRSDHPPGRARLRLRRTRYRGLAKTSLQHQLTGVRRDQPHPHQRLAHRHTPRPYQPTGSTPPHRTDMNTGNDAHMVTSNAGQQALGIEPRQNDKYFFTVPSIFPCFTWIAGRESLGFTLIESPGPRCLHST